MCKSVCVYIYILGSLKKFSTSPKVLNLTEHFLFFLSLSFFFLFFFFFFFFFSFFYTWALGVKLKKLIQMCLLLSAQAKAHKKSEECATNLKSVWGLEFFKWFSHTHTHTHIYIRTYTYICTHIYRHTYTHIHTHNVLVSENLIFLFYNPPFDIKTFQEVHIFLKFKEKNIRPASLKKRCQKDDGILFELPHIFRKKSNIFLSGDATSYPLSSNKSKIFVKLRTL